MSLAWWRTCRVGGHFLCGGEGCAAAGRLLPKGSLAAHEAVAAGQRADQAFNCGQAGLLQEQRPCSVAMHHLLIAAVLHDVWRMPL